MGVAVGTGVGSGSLSSQASVKTIRLASTNVASIRIQDSKRRAVRWTRLVGQN